MANYHAFLFAIRHSKRSEAIWDYFASFYSVRNDAMVCHSQWSYLFISSVSFISSSV